MPQYASRTPRRVETRQHSRLASALVAAADDVARQTSWQGPLRDHGSKYELGWHVSPTANQHDAIAAIELALAEAQRLAGRPLIDLALRDEEGDVVPLVSIMTDNCGPVRSFRFEAFIATHPERCHA